MNTKTADLGVVMGLVALCILLGANLTQLVGAHTALQQAIERQKESDPAVAKVNAQLDTLASATQRLATGGNANAAKIIAALNESGIRIKASHP